mmetsp:Transcript_52179/g.124859  ORF Transcript_52179/g.124859 Transcript_52179/m.124859 type:complete len:215 (-) Transcript_52179:270-914(-)
MDHRISQESHLLFQLLLLLLQLLLMLVKLLVILLQALVLLLELQLLLLKLLVHLCKVILILRKSLFQILDLLLLRVQALLLGRKQLALTITGLGKLLEPFRHPPLRAGLLFLQGLQPPGHLLHLPHHRLQLLISALEPLRCRRRKGVGQGSAGLFPRPRCRGRACAPGFVGLWLARSQRPPCFALSEGCLLSLPRARGHLRTDCLLSFEVGRLN